MCRDNKSHGFRYIRPIEVEANREMETIVGEDLIKDYSSFEFSNLCGNNHNDSSTRSSIIEQYYDFDAYRSAYSRASDFLEDYLHSEKGRRYIFSKQQKKKSRRIHCRTFVFSMLYWMEMKSGGIVNRFPIKSAWKKLVNKKANNIKYGNEMEEQIMRYLKRNERKV